MKKYLHYLLTLLLFTWCSQGLVAQITSEKVEEKKHNRNFPQNQELKEKLAQGKKKNEVPLKDVQSKDISTEFSCNASATIFLENMMRRVAIRTWNENKVKLVTTVYFQGNPAFTDEQWLENLELGISGNAAYTVVKSGNLRQQGMKVAPPQMPLNRRPDTIANGIAVFDSSGNWVNRKSNIKRNIILYIPSGAKLDIESKYADISLDNPIKDIKLQLTNGGITMPDAEKLVVTGIYANIHCGNIGTAQVEMINGRLTAGNIGTLDINSKNTSVDLHTVNTLKMVSQGDNMEIETCNTLSGEKNYGDLRITSLTGSLDISGVNADIKVRSIDPGVRLVKITNQYASLRLPIGELKNYQVSFEGEGGNVYSPFEKTRQPDNSFKTSVGNTTGPSTLFQLKCSNCTVDFK